MTFFKDWRECSQDLIPLKLEVGNIYYIQSQAWALKGYIGGTHSWTTLFSKQHNDWVVIEHSDEETIQYQNGKVLYSGAKTTDITEHSVIVAIRNPNAQWFGHNPVIVDYCSAPDYNAVLQAAKDYPINEFKLLNRNCNTFTSYLHWKLGLYLKRPLRSVGYRNKDWWQSRYK